jgi:hypothetical protein
MMKKYQTIYLISEFYYDRNQLEIHYLKFINLA